MKYLILLITSFAPLLLFAQKNYNKGYIVNLGGDTTYGFIDYREWEYTPASILFATNINDKEGKIYDVSQLKYFNILDKVAYQQFTLKISLDPVILSEIKTRDTSTKVETVFLKVLQTGENISLFSYTDKIKKRFYILAKSKENPLELSYRKFYTETYSKTLVTEPSYINQLTFLVDKNRSDYDKLTKKIAIAQYKESDLTDVALMINGLNKKDHQVIIGNRVSKTRLFAGAGLQRNNLAIDGDHLFAKSTENTSSVSPKVSAGVDYFFNPFIKKIMLRGEVGFQTNKSAVSGTNSDNINYEYSLHSSTISLTPQLIFNVYNTAKLKLPIGVGASYNMVSYSKNLYKEINASSASEIKRTDNYFVLQKDYISMVAKVGAVFNDKIEATIMYQPPTGISTHSFFSIRNSNLNLQFNYLFNR